MWNIDFIVQRGPEDLLPCPGLHGFIVDKEAYFFAHRKFPLDVISGYWLLGIRF
jgi:hypothetical protein